MVETNTNEITIITGLSASEFEIPFPYWSISDISVYLDSVLLKYGINYTLTTYEVAKKLGKFVLYPIDTDWGTHSELKIKRDTSTITNWNPFNYNSLQPEEIVKNFDRVVGMIQDNAVKTGESNDIVLSSEIVYLVEKSAIDTTRGTSRFTDESLSTAIVTYTAYDIYGRTIVDDYNATIEVNNCVAELDTTAKTIRIKDIGNTFTKKTVQPSPGTYVEAFIPYKYEKATGTVPATNPPIYYSATVVFNKLSPQPEVGKSALEYYTPTSFTKASGYAPSTNAPTYFGRINNYEFVKPQPEVGDDVSEFYTEEQYSKASGYAPATNAPTYYERSGEESSYIYTELEPQPEAGTNVSNYYIEDIHYIKASGYAPSNPPAYYELICDYEELDPQPEAGDNVNSYYTISEFSKTSGVVTEDIVYYTRNLKYEEMNPQPQPGADVSGKVERKAVWVENQVAWGEKEACWNIGNEYSSYFVISSFVEYKGIVPVDRPVYYIRSSGVNEDISSGLVILTLTNKYNSNIIIEKNLIAQIIQNGESYSITISSDRGNIFRPGVFTELNLTAHLYQNGNEITNATTLSNLHNWFNWRKVSYYTDVSGDEEFNRNHIGVGHTLKITCSSVNSKATYYCDLMSII